jgi:hypothetical protein
MREIACNLMRSEYHNDPEVGCNVCRKNVSIVFSVNGGFRDNFCIKEVIRTAFESHPYGKNIAINWTKGGESTDGEEEVCTEYAEGQEALLNAV